MKSIKVGKRRLVFGAQWHTLPGAEAQAKEIKELAADTQSKYCVAIAREGTRPIVGFIHSLEGREKNYSAAAVISLLEEGLDKAVFAFAFPDGAAAAICFLDGSPMVGYDVVGAPDVVQAKIAEFIRINGLHDMELRGQPYLFGQEIDPASIGDFRFEDYEVDDKAIKAAAFQRAAYPLVAIGLFAFIIVGSFGGWYAYQEYQAEQLRKMQNQKVDPNIAYEASLKNQLATVGPRADMLSRSLRGKIQPMPLFQGGWKLSEMTCQPSGCSMNWVSDTLAGSTFEGFRKVLPKGWSASYKSDFQNIGVSVDLTNDVPVGLARSLIPRGEDFILQTGTTIQRLKPLGVEYQIRPATLFAVPPMPANQPAITENVLRDPIKEGTWSMSGPWWAFDVAHRMPPNMTLGSVTVDNHGQLIMIRMEGKYYVAK